MERKFLMAVIGVLLNTPWLLWEYYQAIWVSISFQCLQYYSSLIPLLSSVLSLPYPVKAISIFLFAPWQNLCPTITQYRDTPHSLAPFTLLVCIVYVKASKYYLIPLTNFAFVSYTFKILSKEFPKPISWSIFLIFSAVVLQFQFLH